jgi:hypothetical protein
MPDKAPSARDIVKTIESQAEEVRRAATELSRRIKSFEKWLAGLPGKVGASCGEPDDDHGRTSFNIHVQRQGKEWALSYFYFDDENQRFIGDSALLRDASVEVKARAIKLFPKLLPAIRDMQRHTVESVDKLSAKFDEFAAELGIKEGQ